MKKFLLKICILLVLTSVFVSAFPAFAANNVKMQMFFVPGVLNVDTGEISLDINIKNYNLVKKDSFGSICGVTFAFDYSLAGFDVKRDETGAPIVLLDNSLIQSASDILITEPIPGRISFMFLDETLKDRLIDKDGTICRFTLLSKSPLSFWNSVTTYPIRFVPDSIGIVMYHNEKQNVNRLYDVEGIDNVIGAYNLYPTLISPAVGKTISFTLNDASVTVDGQKMETDAVPFLQEGEIMVPVRFLAENLNMEVFWDGESRSVAAFTQFKTLTLSVSDGAVFINSAYYHLVPSPVQVGDRVYVPVSLVSALYPNASVSFEGNAVSIFIP